MLDKVFIKHYAHKIIIKHSQNAMQMNKVCKRVLNAKRLSDSPEVRLETSPQPLTAAPEDLASFVTLKCLVDANPAASVKWYKDSLPLDTSNDVDAPSPTSVMQNRTSTDSGSLWTAEMRFEPVKKQDAGLYSCKASNIVGESSPATYRLDVQCS